MPLLPLVTNPYYSYPFPDQHRFPMQKFALLVDHLKEQGILKKSNVYRPGQAQRAALEMAHCSSYLDRFINGSQSPKEERRMGLPWSQGLVKRSLISPNGTMLATSLALKNGIACHLAGGTHHAHRDFASGFCILNDMAIAALNLRYLGLVKRILIFDCDVHQGDGTATILQNETSITTCSIHCEKNFPYRKAQSDIDINLPKGMRDDEYLKTVEHTLQDAIERSQPDLIIYDAGVDVYEHDPLGLLNISLQGIRERDALIIQTALEQSIPIATVIGGGYDKDQLALAKRHAIVVEEAHRLLKKTHTP